MFEEKQGRKREDSIKRKDTTEITKCKTRRFKMKKEKFEGK